MDKALKNVPKAIQKPLFHAWIILQSIVIYVGLALPFFWFVHLERGIYQVLFMGAVLIADGLIVWLLNRKKLAWIVCLLVSFDWIRIGAVVLVFVVLRAALGQYRSEPIVAPFFSGKNVMFIVPHQDDDVNLAGGIVEQYIRGGSHVTMVFTTNGDSQGLADVRAGEALDAAGRMGLSEEDVIFLGYGDGWQPQEFAGQLVRHIYNSPDETALWTSAHGCLETYGTQHKNCYQEASYSRENYVASIQSIIQEIHPDVIYASDYDAHQDHRALSLFVEEALCNILRKDGDYHPTLYKGFCYRTAWFSSPDFEGRLNLSSSVAFLAEDEVVLNQYPWEERVRVPVLSSGLNRFLTQTDGYQLLETYKSQEACIQAVSIINGDKVFWERATDSLLYNAAIMVAQEPTTLLNDFKLMDSEDICSYAVLDGIQAISGPVEIQSINSIPAKVLGLYDDPSLVNNILEGYVELEGGTQVPFGPLNPEGSVTYIPLPEECFKGFSIHITQWEGTPGLTEIEAYPTDVTALSEELEYFMFTDSEDNFVYDYYLDSPDNSQAFSLYTYPHNAVIDMDAFQITMTGDDACSYSFENGVLQVYCPESKQCKIQVIYKDVICTMIFSNPGDFKTELVHKIQEIDCDIPYLTYSPSPGSVGDQILYYRELVNGFMARFDFLLNKAG